MKGIFLMAISLQVALCATQLADMDFEQIYEMQSMVVGSKSRCQSSCVAGVRLAMKQAAYSKNFPPYTDFEAIKEFATTILIRSDFPNLEHIHWGVLSQAVEPIFDHMAPNMGSDVRKYIFNVLGLLTDPDVGPALKLHMLVVTMLPFLPKLYISSTQGNLVSYYAVNGGEVCESESEFFLAKFQQPLKALLNEPQMRYMSLLIGKKYDSQWHYSQSNLRLLARKILDSLTPLPTVLRQVPMKNDVQLESLMAARNQLQHSFDADTILLRGEFDQQYCTYVCPPKASSPLEQMKAWKNNISMFDRRANKFLDNLLSQFS